MNRYIVIKSNDGFAIFILVTNTWTGSLQEYVYTYYGPTTEWYELTEVQFSILNSSSLYPNPWTWKEITYVLDSQFNKNISFNSIIPLNLKYEYYTNEKLKYEVKAFNTGTDAFFLNLFKNFHDISINKGTCFVLTSAIKLDDIFEPTTTIKIGELPGSLKLQPRNSKIYYAAFNTTLDVVTLSLSGDTLNISPTDENDQVEILINNKYLHVDKEYPYTVRLKDYSLGENEKYRQRFYYQIDENFITIKTLTNAGFRYLTFGTDNILRATGVMFNDSVLNDYVFKYVLQTPYLIDKGFFPENHWVTYYNDYENGLENKSVKVNKNFTNIPVNYLVTFSIDEAIKTGTARINICNLKTLLTPTGAMAPTDNTYSKLLPETE